MSRVVHVSGYYLPHLGGIEHCAWHLSRALLRRGWSVDLVTSSLGAPRAGQDQEGGVTVTRLPAWEIGHTPLIPALPGTLWRQLRDRPTVHLHLSHAYSDLVTALVAGLRRSPLVAHFHMDVQPSGPLGFLLRFYKVLVLPVVMRVAAMVIALSEEQRELLLRRYRLPADKVVVVPNGVELDDFARLRREPPTGPLRVLFVGRFARQKNLPLLLRALAATSSPTQLHLVGDGETRAEVEALIGTLGLADRVTVHGALSGEALSRRWADADVFAMASTREGMPLAALEAMAAGLPVVAADVQGLREFVGEGGLLVPPGDPEALAAAFDGLGADPALRQRLGAAGQAFAGQRGWDSVAVRVLEVYRLAGAAA